MTKLFWVSPETLLKTFIGGVRAASEGILNWKIFKKIFFLTSFVFHSDPNTFQKSFPDRDLRSVERDFQPDDKWIMWTLKMRGQMWCVWKFRILGIPSNFTTCLQFPIIIRLFFLSQFDNIHIDMLSGDIHSENRYVSISFPRDSKVFFYLRWRAKAIRWHINLDLEYCRYFSYSFSAITSAQSNDGLENREEFN